VRESPEDANGLPGGLAERGRAQGQAGPLMEEFRDQNGNPDNITALATESEEIDAELARCVDQRPFRANAVGAHTQAQRYRICIPGA
jgi:hypothetical protein